MENLIIGCYVSANEAYILFTGGLNINDLVSLFVH
jgi:hypothetical protein